MLIDSTNDTKVLRERPKKDNLTIYKEKVMKGETYLNDKVWDYLFSNKRAEAMTAIMDTRSCLYEEARVELETLEKKAKQEAIIGEV